MKGFEPPTPSLPWKCSTPELHWLATRLSTQPGNCNMSNLPIMVRGALNVSGRRDSNSATLLRCENPRLPAGPATSPTRLSGSPAHFNVSGRRDSNPRPSAWKADALPTELLPQNDPRIHTGKIFYQSEKQRHQPVTLSF